MMLYYLIFLKDVLILTSCTQLDALTLHFRPLNEMMILFLTLYTLQPCNIIAGSKHHAN